MAVALNCGVYVNGSDISDKVSRIEIEKDICKIAATCRLELDPNAYSGIDPWDDLEIWEMGAKRFTGYVDEVTKERMPHACVVSGTDVLKRANLYFIHEEQVSSGESLEYWVNKLLNISGLSDAVVYGSTDKTIPENYIFHLQSAGDYIQMIAAYAGWVIYADGLGRIHFKHPDYSSPTHTISSGALTKHKLERSRDRMWIRNRAIVFGTLGIAADVSRSNYYMGNETIVAAVASSEWDTFEKAYATANEMLDEYNDPMDLKWILTPGDTGYELGQTIDIIDRFTGVGGGRSYRALVTNIISEMSDDGYIMRVGTDAKCPRIWGWGRYFPSNLGTFWCSLDGGGAYRWDIANLTWVAQNDGLTGDALFIREIDVDWTTFDIAWAATYDGIYKFYYGFWEKQTLPDPVNDAGDSPAPTYADLDFASIEVISSDYVVTTAKHKTLNRGWLYVYSDSSWSSYQLEV